MQSSLSDIGSFVLAQLAIPVAVAVVTALVTAKVVRWRGAGGEVAEHDRRIAEINEDLRRWIMDRDRVGRVRINEILQQARANGVAAGGAMQQAAGKVYAIVLHEYRDQASSRQRVVESLLDTEGRAHVRYRRRHGRPTCVLMLPDNCFKILERWRQLAEEDVSRPELEPRLAALERPAFMA